MKFVFIFMASFGFHAASFAQDTLKINGQPAGNNRLDVADYSLFFEEQPGSEVPFGKPLSFEEVKKQTFVPYREELRHQRFSDRPLVIQWHKFTVSNTSPADSLHLYLSLSPHYFIRLYDNHKLLARGGAYEKELTRFNGSLLCAVAPLATTTYWVRTEDRMNQLVPPSIFLDTPYTFMRESAMGLQTDRFLFFMLAGLVGCLFFITLYAMFQFYLYRDVAFLWYIGYSTASLMTGLFWMDIRNGLGLFPSIFHDLMLATFVFLAPFFYTFFIGSMLRLPDYFKAGWLVVKCLATVILVQMLIEFTAVRTAWLFFNPDYYRLVLSVVPLLLLHVVLLVLIALSKEKVKWFLFAGVMSLLILWCVPMLVPAYEVAFKRDPLSMIVIFPPAFMMLGLTVEAICFSFALNYRSKLVFLEKNRLHVTYHDELQAALQQRTQELQHQNQLLDAQKIKQIETQFETKIAETEMTALRAQMNPHFIFNCLNSIKLYTLENDAQTASEYLTKFSRLIRLVLENSRSERISLQKELETLKLYIELEAMRFKEKVDYSIAVEPRIDQQYVEIPPLLLQPYVENAIWHGLMHKPEGGHISIDIRQPSEFLLHIEITDNGIGREKAKEHQSKSATRQKSFGLKMTSDRLDAINHIYHAKTEVKIVDLVEAGGSAAGTSVIIEIPL